MVKGSKDRSQRFGYFFFFSSSILIIIIHHSSRFCFYDLSLSFSSVVHVGPKSILESGFTPRRLPTYNFISNLSITEHSIDMDMENKNATDKPTRQRALDARNIASMHDLVHEFRNIIESQIRTSACKVVE
jgi:hypothetical protein